MKYLAHINHDDGRKQSLIDHLHGTAKKAKSFAAVFGEETFGEMAGLYHDIGKYSKEFQNYLKNGGGKKVDHSTAGAKEIISLENKSYVPIAFSIASHHTGLLNCGGKFDVSSESTFYGRMKRKAGEDFPDYSAYKEELNKPLNNQKSNIVPQLKNNFSVQFYVRMLYSCLVDADFLDTENFMQNGKSERGDYPTVFDLKTRFDNFINKKFLSNKNKSEINIKRSEILNECINKGRNASSNILGLTIPTGGGKTISSMAFALNYAVKNNKKRIIYVIPYTSIIEQNAKVFSDIFGEEVVIQHHSNISYDIDENSDAYKYEIIKKAQLATENWDAPIIVTTNVQFFESLFANKSSKCRKLHNIAESVIIFDEAQMIPTGNILPCMYAVTELTNFYKTAVVFCTATQPSLDKIIFDISNKTIEEICGNISENYEFFKRNNIMILNEKLSLNDMINNIENEEQILIIVNSKKAAGEIFNSLSEKENVFYLSTNLCAKHRTKNITEIKKLLKEKKACKVISTSLIEAGVDIDFPKIYRELTGLDSIIQSAGRCNREGNFDKNESLVCVFEWNDKELLYKGNDLKPKISATKFVLEKNYKNIDGLNAIKCYFDFLHKFQGGGLDANNVMNLINDSPCQFKDIDEKFVMIEDATIPIFIPFDEAGENILNEIKSGNFSRDLIRKSGPYLVNVYKSKFDKMLEAHYIEYANNEDKTFAYLYDKKYYDENLGVLQDVKEGKGIFL